MRRFQEKLIRGLSVLRSRCLAVSLLCLTTCALIFWIPAQINTVYIDDGSRRFLVRTTEDDPNEILIDNGISLARGDAIHFSGFSDSRQYFDNTAEISVERGFPVKILADSRVYHLTMAGGTVSDALFAAGIDLRNTDAISHTPHSLLESGEQINITRIDYKTTTAEEPIPRSTVYKSTSLIRDGRQSLLSYGSDGLRLLTYEQKTVDGVQEDMVLVSEDIAKVPVPDTYLVGDGSAISPLDFGYEMVDGHPANYKYLLSEKKATGYSARYGAGTASGLHRAAVGYVAVDPRIIPYGTKLYITASSDTGHFVYGYAIAADTGTGLMSGIVDIDLFYDSYYESVLNGLRIVDIYVLE